MAKIAYNACYGGFALSRSAVLRAREISGNPTWGGVCIAGDVYEGGEICPSDFGHINGIARHDPVLIQVIEELGSGAGADYSDLQFHEVQTGMPYRIDEYDGNESVMTKEDYEWIIAP